jgi:hypothetical protein
MASDTAISSVFSAIFKRRVDFADRNCVRKDPFLESRRVPQGGCTGADRVGSASVKYASNEQKVGPTCSVDVVGSRFTTTELRGLGCGS